MAELRMIDGIPVDPMVKETTTASEDFKKNILSNRRYVDKTHLLIPLLRGDHETTFFLRPRRFGKTLTLSMIRYFVEDTRKEEENAQNRDLFDGLKIMTAGVFYTRQMTACPVINLTFQAVKSQESFKDAYDALVAEIQDEYERHAWLLESDGLTERNRLYFRRVMMGLDERTGKQTSMADYRLSLKRLSEFLRKATGKKTVVLIDEYDVPLEKAYQGGYYKKMIGILSPLLQNVLKTNSENLQFAVVTGCLRIAKESIYTGLNNPEVNTVLSDSLSDVIGFTEKETAQLLADSGFPDHFEEVRDWYDGYRFGTTKIYNPWSVIRHIEELSANPNAQPGQHWAGTSENAIIREMAAKGSPEVKAKVECLLQGESIPFAGRDNIVYAELDYHDDNVFNVMLHTGYLTAVARDSDTITAVIPNREVHKIYRDQIRGWFEESVKLFDVRRLYTALERGDAEGFRELLVGQFMVSMSYFDTQEAYYHGMLLALLAQNTAFRVSSNRESGSGRFDLQCAEIVKRRNAFVLEVKISSTRKAMSADALRGARQARTKKYAIEALREGYACVRTYGIAFHAKDCSVCAGTVYSQADLKTLILK